MANLAISTARHLGWDRAELVRRCGDAGPDVVRLLGGGIATPRAAAALGRAFRHKPETWVELCRAWNEERDRMLGLLEGTS